MYTGTATNVLRQEKKALTASVEFFLLKKVTGIWPATSVVGM
jgi:hypothetical protein